MCSYSYSYRLLCATFACVFENKRSFVCLSHLNGSLFNLLHDRCFIEMSWNRQFAGVTEWENHRRKCLVSLPPKTGIETEQLCIDLSIGILASTAIRTERGRGGAYSYRQFDGSKLSRFAV